MPTASAADLLSQQVRTMCDPEVINARQKAIELAHESTKQILTLSSALLTAIIGITLVSKIESSTAAGFAAAASGAYFFSIVFGLLSLYALAGILEAGLHVTTERPLMTDHYRNFGLLQLVLFAVASLLTFFGTFLALV